MSMNGQHLSFIAHAYRIGFITNDSRVGTSTNLAPTITLYSNKNGTSDGLRASLTFWPSGTEIPAASLEGKMIHGHFEEGWYDRILAVLESGDTVACNYHKQANQTCVNIKTRLHTLRES